MSLHNFRLLCPSATLFHRGQLFTKSIKASFPWYAIRQKVLDNSLLKNCLDGHQLLVASEAGARGNM